MSVFSRLRQRYGRFRKRGLFVSLAVLIVLSTLALGILAAAGIFGTRAELCSIRLTKNASTVQSFQGTGINLDYIPLNNFVRDGSFESFSSFESFHIDSAEGNLVYFDEEGSGLDTTNVENNKIRIYTFDEDGALVPSVEAAIVSYNEADFGILEELNDRNIYWTHDRLKKTAVHDNSLVSITEEGFLVADITSEELSKRTQIEGDSFVDLCSSADGIFALTAQGKILFSSDGKNFSVKDTVPSSFLGSGVSAKMIAAINKSAWILLSNGHVINVAGAAAEDLGKFNGNARYIINTSDHICVITDDGDIFYSSNGLLYREYPEAKKLLEGKNVLDITTSSDAIGILLEGGETIILDPVDSSSVVIEGRADTTKICVVNKNEILFVASDGKISFWADGQFRNLEMSKKADDVFNGVSGRLCLYSGTSLSQTSVLSSFRINSTIAEDQVFKGDICYIERDNTSCSAASFNSGDTADIDEWGITTPGSSWDVYGDGTMLSAIDEAPAGYGKKCARLLGTKDGLHVMSQQLGESGDEVFNENDFLSLQLYLAEYNTELHNAKIWISSEGCADIGFAVEDLTSNFQESSYVFVASDELIKSKNAIRLNIAFEGAGELRVDGVYLGLEKFSGTQVPDDFRSVIVDAEPNCIRLNNLRIGSEGIGYDSLYSLPANSNSVVEEGAGKVNNCSSLEESLKIVKESSAYPWFVIGPNANYDVIDSLLEYLCGSLSTTYGKIRIDNGTAVPWSRQFSKIVVEINDADGVFVSDMQKSAYVNFISTLIRQSEYYTELKDKITFADGMYYEGGTMLSNADCHCSGFVTDNNRAEGESYIQHIDAYFVEANNGTPRVSSYVGGTGEFISSLKFDSDMEKNQYTAGEFMSAILSDESLFAGMVLVDINASRTFADYDKLLDSNNQTFLRCLNIIKPLAFSKRLSVEIQKPLSDNSPYTLEGFASDCNVAVYRYEDTRFVVIANATDSQQQFLINGVNMSLDGAVVSRYSSEGKLLQTQTVSARNRNYTLQPGQVMTMTVAE